MKKQSVFSSSVTTIGYDEEDHELHVEWKNGRTSVYSGVPADVAQKVMTSWSVGGALADEIKPNYRHRYL